jgi:SecD/SecF fusion protein
MTGYPSMTRMVAHSILTTAQPAVAHSNRRTSGTSGQARGGLARRSILGILISGLLAVLMLQALSAGARAQEGASAPASTAQSDTAATATTGTETVAADTATSGAGETKETDDARSDPLADPITDQPAAATDTPSEPATQTDAAQGQEEEQSAFNGLLLLALLIALFVIPMFLGNRLSKRFRMPDYGWKFGLAIGTVAAAVVVVAFGEVKFGPDLSGGITLIYELQDTSEQTAQNVAADESQGEDGAGGTATAEDGSPDQPPTDADKPRPMKRGHLIEQLIAALGERVDPSGTKEVTIRKYGEAQIEIIIPEQGGQQEMDYIKRRISTSGALEFRITASPTFSENRDIIQIAQKLPPGINDVRIGKNKVAEWVAYNVDEFGPVDQPDERVVKRIAGEIPQALILVNDGQDVTGDYLRSATSGIDNRGGPAVNFTFDVLGSIKFGRLTGDHVPNASGQKYYLGIVLDKKLISAPSINEQIRDNGQISGRFTKEEVDFNIGILNAGSLPAALNKEPISSNQISPTLGAETVEKGKEAIVTSLVIVMLFMVFYYRFAGFVACLALATNLLLILGLMVLLKAAFTLPGLAGLVLTVGMSVDANVLIFERIREELSRGAALRMAIRNGFARATRTIVDANVTTLITAVVIYKIAPDNVKGFGVTLILGIIMSMYSAIFLSRIVFDVADRTRRLKTLGMRQLIGHTNFDFLGKRNMAAFFSSLIIAIGIVGIWSRGGDLLNIDFTGGSSVTMVLDDDHAMPYSEVKERLGQSEIADQNLSVVEVGETGTQYTISCVEQDVQAVQTILQETFSDQLRTHQVELENFHTIPGIPGANTADDDTIGQATSAPATRKKTPFSLVSYQQEEGAADPPAADTPAGDAPAADPPAADAPAGDAPAADTQEPGISDPTGAQAADSAGSSSADSGDGTPETEPSSAPASEPGTTDGPASEQPTGEPLTATDDQTSDEQPADNGALQSSDPFAGGTGVQVLFHLEGSNKDPAIAAEAGTSDDAGVNHDTAYQFLQDALVATGNEGVAIALTNPMYTPGSARRFDRWDVKLALPRVQAEEVLHSLQETINSQPIFPLANKIGGRVAGNMTTAAIAAIVASLAGIVAYIWFRFQGVIYGMAAVIALVHDVAVTLGAIALSAYVVDHSGLLANSLMIEKFQISLPIVAALLTIIGYSLNDTIVVFDRIREVKGKSPKLTGEMINTSINQTLARTLLTSLTTLLTVLILYFIGGDGIHGFAFSLVIGVVVGTYSSIFVASPALLWLSNRATALSAKNGTAS